VTNRRVPARHWRCYGDGPLPTGQEALDEPFRAFPPGFMRVTCDRCGREHILIRDILDRMRHDGCGGRPGRVELLTSIEGSSLPVRKIVLAEG
jgi:hypothetical protein